MPNRLDRVNELKAAYEEYYRHLGSVGADKSGPSSLGFVMQNGDAQARLALKLAVYDIFGRK